MCACMPVCFQRNLVTFAKARTAQMIFITTSRSPEIRVHDKMHAHAHAHHIALPCV